MNNIIGDSVLFWFWSEVDREIKESAGRISESSHDDDGRVMYIIMCDMRDPEDDEPSSVYPDQMLINYCNQARLIELLTDM